MNVLAIALLLVPLAGEDKKLEGTWIVTAMTFNGKETPATALKNRRFVIKDGTLTAWSGEKKGNVLTIKVDASKKPPHIDLRRASDDSLSHGIYELTGDRLKLCYGEPGAERPTAVKSEVGERRYLLILERKKP